MVTRAREDLTGKTIGRWLVEGPGGRDKFRAWTWICRCSCGKRKRVMAQSLLRGKSLSCGCHKEDTTAAIFIKDETGKTYGNWTVLKYSHSENWLAYWLCECACGRQVYVRGTDLRRKLSTGCGRCSAKSNAQGAVRHAKDTLIMTASLADQGAADAMDRDTELHGLSAAGGRR